jgi:hypothetical protein
MVPLSEDAIRHIKRLHSIAVIKNGQKINDTTGSLDSKSFVDACRRWFSGENRKKNISNLTRDIKNLYNFLIHCVMYDEMKLIFTEIPTAIQGLNELSETYRSDPITQNDINLVKVQLRRCLILIEKRIGYKRESGRKIRSEPIPIIENNLKPSDVKRKYGSGSPPPELIDSP